MALQRLFHRLVCCHIVVIVLLLGRSAFSQNTINVPADRPTIQAGINAANNGDTALSCAGLPGFVGCAFSPSVVIPDGNGASSALTISTSARTSKGTFSISVIGKSGSLQHSATIALTVK